MSDGQIADDEVIYRRIPSGEKWFQPPDRISSYNFKLRCDEFGISVYRASIVDAATVLSDLRAIPGSQVAKTTVGQVRAAKDGNGELLNLDVVAVNDENDPGHAEIRGPIAGKISSSASNTLRKLFTLVEPPHHRV